MKSIRNIALGVLMGIAAFSAIMYSSCSKTKDACSGVTCLHNGTCSSGVCTSCGTGWTGKLCDTAYRTWYANVYKGNGTDNETPVKTYTNTKMTLVNPNDTNYIGMMALIELQDNSGNYVSLCNLPITLTNFTASGATFTITSTVQNGWRYSGSGTLTLTSASLTLNEADTATVAPLPTIIYSWGSMAKQ